MRILVFWLMGWCVFGGSSAIAEGLPAETFTPPKHTKVVRPNFPSTSAQEGWVRLALMVDPQGTPYDIAIVESSGVEAFEKSAVRAAKQWRYDPAVLNGQPIDAGMVAHVTFAYKYATGATRRFVNRQKRLHAAIEAKDREAADRVLAAIRERDRNLYEEAFLNLSLYHYYGEWGTPDQQLEAIVRTTYMDGDSRFLPERTLVTALMRKLSLQERLGLLKAAQRTAKRLGKFELSEAREASIASTLSRVQARIDADEPLQRNGRIAPTYRFFHRLARPSFAFDQIEGDIAELRLHCDKAYLGMAYVTDMTYTVPEDHGSCHLTVIGDPDTTFRLTEFASVEG